MGRPNREGASVNRHQDAWAAARMRRGAEEPDRIPMPGESEWFQDQIADDILGVSEDLQDLRLVDYSVKPELGAREKDAA